MRKPIVKQIETSLEVFELYKAIVAGEDQIFLDSSKNDAVYGRYSIIGATPFLTIKYENEYLYEKAPKHSFTNRNTQDVFDYLNEKIEQYKIENHTNLPFLGGAMGYFSYDLGCRLENITTKSEQIVQIPDAYFVFYDNVIIIDHDLKQVFVTGLGILEDADISISKIIEIIRLFEDEKMSKVLAHEETSKPLLFQSAFTKNEYKVAVEKMRQFIREGDIYIANMTHTFTSDFCGDPMQTYERLRKINPAPFSAYLPLNEFSILSSSPERFLRIENGQVETRPIKGTIPRGSTLTEDILNRKKLEESEKDKSELLMIVDLERNDLSKVCQVGTVKVPELFTLEAFSTVYHLVSTVTGTLKNNATAVDCVKATFPGGSITGAPKIRAMEIIDELERNQRNVYTGCIGYFGFDGNADFNIIIRSILIKDHFAHIGVGGGITWESDAEREYEETIAKAVALFQSLEAEYLCE